jgi:transcriptional regulator with XRE-family HTH domain
MTIGIRLKKFIEYISGTQSNFARLIQISPVVLNRYISGKMLPGADVMLKFQKVGLSIDWLLSGKGKMLHENSDAIQQIQEENKLTLLPIMRLNNWINNNFNSIENFAFLINYDINILNNILCNDIIPEPNFINIVRVAGCNINWLASGEGVEYENNYIGMILKSRKENPDMKAKTEIRIDMRKINDFTTIEFYDLIKAAVNEQLKTIISDTNEKE